MTNDDLKKMWLSFLVDNKTTTAQIARDINSSQQGLNKKINKGSIRYTELSNIVEKYGYSIEIHKVRT